MKTKSGPGKYPLARLIVCLLATPLFFFPFSSRADSCQAEKKAQTHAYETGRTSGDWTEFDSAHVLLVDCLNDQPDPYSVTLASAVPETPAERAAHDKLIQETRLYNMEQKIKRMSEGD